MSPLLMLALWWSLGAGSPTPGPAAATAPVLATTPAPPPLSSPASISLSDFTSSWLRTITTQFRRLKLCVPLLGPAHCLKLEALLLLHGEDSTEVFNKESSVESRHQALMAMFPEDPSLRELRINEVLLRAVGRALQKALEIALRPQPQPPGSELQQRGKRRKRWGNQIVLALFVLAGTLVATGIGKTAMIAGKALAVSILALMLAVVTGFRRSAGGGGAGGTAKYEIFAPAIRRRAGMTQNHREAEAPGEIHLYLEPGADLQTAGQSLAYSMHHTRGSEIVRG